MEIHTKPAAYVIHLIIKKHVLWAQIISRHLYFHRAKNVTFTIQAQARPKHPQACITIGKNLVDGKHSMHCINYSTWQENLTIKFTHPTEHSIEQHLENLQGPYRSTIISNESQNYN